MNLNTNILSYLEGSLDEIQKKEFEQRLDSDALFQAEFQEFKSIWVNSSRISTYKKFDVEREWNEFLHNYVSHQSPLKIVKSKDEVKSWNWRNTLSVAASVSLLIFSTWFFWPQSEFIEIVNAEIDTELTLADGSIVNIKKGSSLKTLRSYEYAAERKAEIDGEVNFDIASDPTKAFIVETDETAIRVLGTKFNVIATGVESEVANEEGKVRFYVIEDDSKSVDLNKGDRIKYDGNEFIDLNEKPAPPIVEKPAPLVANLLTDIRKLKNITFGSTIEAYQHVPMNVEVEGKNIYQVIEILEQHAIVVYTRSCEGCFKLIEIIPFRNLNL